MLTITLPNNIARSVASLAKFTDDNKGMTPILSAVHLRFDTELGFTFYATDRYKAASFTAGHLIINGDSPDGLAASLPANIIKQLAAPAIKKARWITLDIDTDAATVALTVDGAVYSSPLLAGKYPPIWDLIKEPDVAVTPKTFPMGSSHFAALAALELDGKKELLFEMHLDADATSSKPKPVFFRSGSFSAIIQPAILR